jgi:hypothetical protein
MRRLNLVETECSKAASAFCRRLQEKDKLVKLASDSTELTLAPFIMSYDEWIHRGLVIIYDDNLSCRSLSA